MANIFLTKRFFLLITVISLLFLFGLFHRGFFFMAMLSLLLMVVAFIFDMILLFREKEGIKAFRNVSDRLSNGDHNPIQIQLENGYAFATKLKVIDEIPHQFQRRDVGWEMNIGAGEQSLLEYQLRPVKRGEYHFGAVNVFVTTSIRFIERRYRFSADKMVKVYPSYIQLRKFGFAAINQKIQQYGLKRQRRLGHTMEFEQIKEYIPGDDPRSINWKATGRANQLMINQYRDERSQQIFNVIDKGRLMRMPFDGLSLLDYSINSALVLSFIALNKQDKAGLVTFGQRMSSYVPAGKRRNQMKLIVDALYNQRTKYLDANFERLTGFLTRQVRHRSLLIMYTNFESVSGLERQLPYLKMLSKRHVMVVVLFENTGLVSLLNHRADHIREIYHQGLAEKLGHEKQLIKRRLQQAGIHVIHTKPQDLTVNTINKYLELKGRGMI